MEVLEKRVLLAAESFETGLGSWIQGSGDDGDWTRTSGGTSSSSTGPSGAQDGSFYLYTEASSGANPGNPNQSAYLQQNFDFSSLSSPELTFYYHMYGAAMGTLSVDVNDGSGYVSEWSRSGQQHTGHSDAWTQATVDLSGYGGDNSVTVRFRGITGTSFTSDMAIDNVEVTDAGGGITESLYLSDINGVLRTVNQTSASTTFVGNFGTSGTVTGLTSRGSDPDFLYAVTGTRLLRVDADTGSATALPEFNETTLGFSNPFAQSVAISPTSPNVAVVAGINDSLGRFLWNVDVTTGSVLGAATTMSDKIYAMTFSLDGSTLYGTNSIGQLVTINTTTGSHSLVGDPGLSNFIEGLAFRPSDGKLFAVDAFTADDLVEINPSTGSFVANIGSLGITAPDGLAFLTSGGGGGSSATPTGVDLLAGSDTGVSSSDDITNLDNSSAGKSLQFSVSGTVSGATVTLYNGASVIGTATASGTTTTVTTNGSVDLADGLRSITATQTETGKSESLASTALPITIDTVAPAAPGGRGQSEHCLDAGAEDLILFDCLQERPQLLDTQHPLADLLCGAVALDVLRRVGRDQGEIDAHGGGRARSPGD